MRTKARTLAGALAAAALAAGVGTAASAAGGHPPDPTAERNLEAQFTEAHRSDSQISQAAAEHAAQQARPGAAFDAHLENEGHGLRWEVKTDDGTRVWELQMDVTSGAVVSNQPEE